MAGRLLAIALLLALLSPFLYDILYPYLHEPPWSQSCATIVIDVYNETGLSGPCIYDGLTPLQLRLLGRAGARRVIIVTHAFEGKPPGLGVSRIEHPLLFSLAHPVTALFLARGSTDWGEEYTVALPGLLRLTPGLGGKEVYIVTCSGLLSGLERYGVHVVGGNVTTPLEARELVLSMLRNIKGRDG